METGLLNSYKKTPTHIKMRLYRILYSSHTLCMYLHGKISYYTQTSHENTDVFV